jgi:hypothetical protein
MHERDILEEEVREAVDNPTRRKRGRSADRLVFEKDFKNKVLRVICEKKGNSIIIISAHWL